MADTVGSEKTGQNLERLNKISDKLNAIHFNIQNDKTTKCMEIDTTLGMLEQNINDSQDEVLKEFNQTKKDIAELIQTIESTPDTVITLVNEKKFIVEEAAEEVVRRVMKYRRALKQL